MQETIPKLLREIVTAHADRVAQYSKDDCGVFQPTTYLEFYSKVQMFAAGLHAVGVRRGDHVGLISDNRKEWLIADQAIIGLGAADVPRGCDSMAAEIHYILDFAECKVTIVENIAQLRKVKAGLDRISKLKTIIVIDTEGQALKSHGGASTKVLSYDEVMAKGEEKLEKDPSFFDEQIAEGKSEDVATIIFTSGTTGEPKGVVLTHANFLFQIQSLPPILDIGPGDVFLSVLPVWHSFERIVQYMIIGTGMTMAYSKPIGQVMLADIAAIRPTWMASVPRIWESVMTGVEHNVHEKGAVTEALFRFFVAIGGAHATLERMVKGFLPEFRRRIRIVDMVVAFIPYLLLKPLRLLGEVLVFRTIKERLGGRFVATVSGGGALPGAVDRFFASIGILLLEGYGLTETAPVLCVRHRYHPVPNTVGPPLPGTQIRIVDESFNDLPPGRKGVVLVKGGQVMRGYFRRDELTNKVLSDDGWLNTGDLGMLTWKGELRLMGREKDTIVLLGGENVEPAPIEQKLKESPYISEAVVVGQDQKYLAALIVPNLQALEGYCRENGIPYIDTDSLTMAPEVHELIDSEVNQLVSAKSGFRIFERIFRFKLIPHEFSVNKELSHKQEVKRHVIAELYNREIQDLFLEKR